MGRLKNYERMDEAKKKQHKTQHVIKQRDDDEVEEELVE